jgi:peptidoglycan/xylan/chitin deacetylase (PgdA/CDA1 family)
MKIYCQNNAFITEPVRYTIDYMLNRSGFFFEWMDQQKKHDATGLKLIYGPEETLTGTDKKTIYLAQYFKLEELHQTPSAWTEVRINKEEIPVLKQPGKDKISRIIPSLSSIDIIANVYYHLTRIEELGFRYPEDTDKNVENSILFMDKGFMNPVADVLIDFFKTEIEEIFRSNSLFLIKKAHYPQGQDFGIAFTHDVDFIRAFHPLKKIWLKILILTGLKKNLSLKGIETLDRNAWGFDRLLDFYRKNKYKATFFFLAKYMEGVHFRYRIGSRKIKQLLKQLKQDGHEIAFHPSRYAFDKPERYKKEKDKLEWTAKIKLSGLRHHYLRCLFPKIWEICNRLGLKYDAGMIHRFYSGFRAGTCFPFPAFDHLNKKPIDIIEFPTTFFENTLPEHGYDVEKSKKVIQELLEKVKTHGGLFNILWHTNNIYQSDNYKYLWQYLTELIQNEDIFHKPLSEHYDWYQNRSKIKIDSIKKSESGFIIHFDIPENIKEFSLVVPSQYKYLSPSELQYDIEKNKLIIKNENETGIILEAQTSE